METSFRIIRMSKFQPKKERMDSRTKKTHVYFVLTAFHFKWANFQTIGRKRKWLYVFDLLKYNFIKSVFW